MIAGFILLVAVSYAIPHTYPVTIGGVEYTSYADIAVGVPWATIFEFATGRTIGLLLILIVIVAQFFCGMSSITANSRMVYAFSRDGAMPFSNYWHRVSKGAPSPSVPPGSAPSGPSSSLSRTSSTSAAYYAVTSHRRDRVYISYLTPVFLRRINPSAFNPGPWVLSKTWGPIIDWIAIIWVVFIVILLMLPQCGPITRTTSTTRPSRCSRHRLRRPLVRALGPQVVHGPEDPGYRRRARRDRGRPRII